MNDGMEIPLAEMVECARREVQKRKAVCPALIKQKRLSAAKAAHEIEMMENIVVALQALAELRATVTKAAP
jgi:hypothetical protein